jgi:Cys-tRNA(Pro) deacylase
MPSTQATRFLKSRNVHFTAHRYRYEEHGGTGVPARVLGVPERMVIKTLVMEDDNGLPLIVLMHGDMDVSTRQLARQAGRRVVSPCRPDVAERHTGYQVGGTSPFGTRKALPVFMEKTVLDLPVLYINGGSRGFLVEMSPADVMRVLEPTIVEVGIGK